MMQDVSVTYRDGQTAQLQNIYVRGSQVCFMVLPDMLKNAPMLRQQRSSTGGRDRILKTQVGRGGGRGRPREAVVVEVVIVVAVAAMEIVVEETVVVAVDHMVVDIVDKHNTTPRRFLLSHCAEFLNFL